MIKLKNLLLEKHTWPDTEEKYQDDITEGKVDKKELKSSIKEAIEAATKLNRALNNITNIFVRHHGDVRKAMTDPLFIMVNKIINIRGKIKKLYTWKKHFDKLEKKLWLN